MQILKENYSMLIDPISLFSLVFAISSVRRTWTDKTFYKVLTLFLDVRGVLLRYAIHVIYNICQSNRDNDAVMVVYK